MSRREFIVQGVGKPRFTTIDETGKRRVYDMDKPDREMLRQLCEVASRRVNDSHAILKMLYIDNEGVPEPALRIKGIFQELLVGELSPTEAEQQILALRDSF